MNVNQANRIIIKPYVSERTFAMVDEESKICFIVDRSANKSQIAQAVVTLYRQKVLDVNTARTLYGKKAFVKFESPEKARDLATDIGVL